ncbi:MAG: hypothetical protein PVH61_42385 [Candidatus Aminicenantes bacterium]
MKIIKQNMNGNKSNEYRTILFQFELIGNGETLHFVMDDLCNLKGFLDVLDGLITENRDKEINILEEEIEKLKIKNAGNYCAWNFPCWDGLFREQLYKSFIISLYSIAEEYLKLFCEELSIIDQFQFDWDNETGSTYERVKKNLKKADPPIPNDFLSFFQKLNLIRNQVIHNSSMLPENEKKRKRIMDFVSKRSDISIKSELSIEFDHTFCDQAYEEIQKIFLHFNEKIVEHFKMQQSKEY